MAEEKTGEEVAEPLNTPEEVEPQTPQEEQAEPEPIVTLATEMGWTPKDQWRGDPDEWKPATEFIKAGRDITRTVSRQLRQVQDELGRVTRTSAQLMEDKIAERDAYWQGIHRKAVEDGDVALAERAVTERGKLKDSAPAPDSSLPPETAAFMERNRAWFGASTPDGRFTGGDPLARTRAMEICDQLAKQGVPPDEQLRQAERAVRKEYPELFPKQAKPPAGVQTAQSRSAGGGSTKKGFADMPAESQKLAQDYLARHGIPLEQFAEKYWQQNERKVG